VTQAFLPATVEDLVDGLVALFDVMTGPNRIITSARLAMIIEAGHDEELRSTLAAGRRVMERTIVPAFAMLGAPMSSWSPTRWRPASRASSCTGSPGTPRSTHARPRPGRPRRPGRARDAR
jgi:hypothetical protein